MRGSPILRAVLVFVALLALAPLLWKLTQPAVARIVPQPRPQVKRATVEGRLNFSTAATCVVIQHLGRDIWSKASPALAENLSVEIPWPKEGIELHVLITWPGGTRNAAMRVRLTAPDGTEYDRTVWGDATADEVLTFP
ncbi:MAG: hypothetical protein ABI318_01675 [Chthoniobacteraceae bacterium]